SVDFSTGNIDFNGDIVVRRGVRDRFTLRANNVEVHGLIEAATVIARQRMRALGGFAGRERGAVRVGKVLEAKYLDNVEGEIGSELEFEREIINCDLVVQGAVRSTNGAILGGRTVVTGPCHVGQVGSAGGSRTLLMIGAVPRLDPLAAKLRPVVEKLQARHRQLGSEAQEIEERIENGTASPSDREQQTSLMFSVAESERTLNKAEPALGLLEATIAEARTVDLTVHRRLHQDAIIGFDGQQYRVINGFKGPVRVTIDFEANLLLEDASGPRGTFGELCQAGELDRTTAPLEESDIPSDRLSLPDDGDGDPLFAFSKSEELACAS
ncbi:MAG: FapA family protein, partial [Planctomycetota bacterium]